MGKDEGHKVGWRVQPFADYQNVFRRTRNKLRINISNTSLFWNSFRILQPEKLETSRINRPNSTYLGGYLICLSENNICPRTFRLGEACDDEELRIRHRCKLPYHVREIAEVDEHEILSRRQSHHRRLRLVFLRGKYSI